MPINTGAADGFVRHSPTNFLHVFGNNDRKTAFYKISTTFL